MESQTKLSYQQRRRNIMATLALTNFQKQWILQTTQSILQPYDPTMRFPTLHLIPASEKTMQKITASLIASLLCKGKKKRIVMLVPTPYPIVDLVAKTIIDERLLCDEDLVKEKTKMQMTVQIHDTANKNLFTNTLRVITASSRLVKGIGGDVFICLLNGMDASVLQTITKEIIAPQMRIPETRFVFDDASKVMIDNESNESKMDQSKKDEVENWCRCGETENTKSCGQCDLPLCKQCIHPMFHCEECHSDMHEECGFRCGKCSYTRLCRKCIVSCKRCTLPVCIACERDVNELHRKYPWSGHFSMLMCRVCDTTTS